MGSPTQQPWTADEDVTLRKMWADGKRKRAISTRLGRTDSSVASRMRVLGIIPRLGDKVFVVERDFEAERAENVERDKAFRAAMQKAIDEGSERQPSEIRMKPTTKRFFPVRTPIHHSSYCSSSALACAELGEDSYGLRK